MINNSKRFAFIVFTISFLVALIITEIFLNMYDSKNKVKYDGVKRYIRFRSPSIGHESYNRPSRNYLQYTSNLYDKEYRIEIDSLGYIYPSHQNKNSDSNILFLGGSTTECLYVDEYKRWPYLIMEHFNKMGIMINSYNGGNSGNHSLHSINKLLNNDLKNNLDIVVLMHNVNDLTTLLYEKTYWNSHKSRSLIKEISDIPAYKNATTKNYIRRLFPNTYDRYALMKEIIFKSKISYNDEWNHIRGKHFEIKEDEILKQFEKSLFTFIEICLIHEIKPILMTQANRVTINPDEKILQNLKNKILNNELSYNRYKKIYDGMNEKIREVSLLKKTHLIDLDKIVPKDSLYLYDMVHYTEYGSIFVSEKIFNELYKDWGTLKKQKLNHKNRSS